MERRGIRRGRQLVDNGRILVHTFSNLFGFCYKILFFCFTIGKIFLLFRLRVLAKHGAPVHHVLQAHGRESIPSVVHDSVCEELSQQQCLLVPHARPAQDISREFPRALDVGAHAGQIYRAICEKVLFTGGLSLMGKCLRA